MSRINKGLLLAAIITAPSIGLAVPISESGAGFAFPDNDPNGNSSAATVADDLLVNDLSVTISGLSHTWVGDLIVTLTSPSGTDADLMFRTGDAQGDCCGDSSDLGGDYTFADGGADWWAAAAAAGGGDVIPGGTYAPTTILGAAVSFSGVFGGESTMGDWLLTISDEAGGDLGSIQAWTLDIDATDPGVPEPGIALLMAAGLLGVGFSRFKGRK